MGTKNNPGTFDCHGHAGADEPIFTIRAKDPVGAAAVRAWIKLREAAKLDKPQEAARLMEAEMVATAMEEWRTVNVEGKAYPTIPDALAPRHG